MFILMLEISAQMVCMLLMGLCKLCPRLLCTGPICRGAVSPFGITRCSCLIYTLNSSSGSRVSCCLAQQLPGSPMTLTPLSSPLLQKELCSCRGPSPLCPGVVKNWHEVGVLHLLVYCTWISLSSVYMGTSTFQISNSETGVSICVDGCPPSPVYGCQVFPTS